MPNLYKTVPLLIVSSVLLSGCEKPPMTAEAPRLVKLIEISPTANTQQLELAGEIRARIESPLSFRVAGKIVKRLVETGQSVKKGQVLAELDPRDYQLAQTATNSQVTAAQADLDLAQAEYRRFLELQQKQFVSDLDLDRKKVAVSAAAARLKSLQSNASLDSNRIGDTLLKADADGVVSQVQADVGMVVEAGQPIVILAQQGEREIAVDFPEDRRDLAKTQTTGSVSLWAQPQTQYQAELRELSAVADPATRTFRARYRIQAPNNAFALGQSATLKLNVATQSSGFKLPTSALMGSNKQTQVWSFNQDSQILKALPVNVVGIEGNDVLVSGLQAGQHIVVAGVHVLHEGQKVRPMPTKTTP